MKIVILDGHALNPGDLSWEWLHAFGTYTYYDRTSTTALTIQRIGDADIIILNKTPITEEILQACPSVKLICIMATGYNVVDCAAAAKHNIPVCNVPGYGTNAVAQFTIALLLELCNRVGLHNDSVHNGEWTLDKFIEYTSGMYSDLDGNQAPSLGDRYGLAVTEVHFDAFYTGADMVTIEVDQDGALVVSEDLFSQKAVDVVDTVYNLLNKSGDSETEKGVNSFKEGNVLFVIERASALSRHLSSVSFSFGILPIPKYDTNQESYKTCLSFPYTMYMISTAANNANAAAATIQLMAYESYKTITPALFEESMKSRYADQSDDALIFDYIREGVVIDIGRLFTKQLDNLSYSIFRGAVKNSNAGGYASTAARYTKTLNSKLKTINESIDALK